MLALAAAAALAFSPLAPLASTPARASAPVMSEMTTRRAALLGIGAAVVGAAPLSANAVSATPIWKTSKKGIGANKGPPKGSGADKCSVVKPCTSGAGLKWDPAALGVKKGAPMPDGSNPRQFLKSKTYLNSPIG